MKLSKRVLIPRKIINVTGKVKYSESAQAWSVIKLKKEFLNEFPKLKEKRSKFSYDLVFFRDMKELEESIKELKKEETSAIPVLMFLSEDN